MQTRLVTPEECCLHIIDPQKSLMNKIHEADRVTKVICLLVNCSRVFGLPIVANTQYIKGLGPYGEVLESTMGNIPRFDKVEFSAYKNKKTVDYVKNIPSLTTVILVGVETHICVYQSAIGILEMGLTPWIVADGVSSRSVENHRLGLERLRDAGAVIGPAEMIIYELLGKAGTLKFKEVLPYIIDFNT